MFCSSKHDDSALWKWGVALTHIVLVNGPHEWEWSHKIALHKAVQLSYSLEVHLISRQRTCLAIHFLEHWPSLPSARLQFCSHSFIGSNKGQTLFTSTPSLYKEGTHFCTWVLIGWNYRFRVLLKLRLEFLLFGDLFTCMVSILLHCKSQPENSSRFFFFKWLKL